MTENTEHDLLPKNKKFYISKIKLADGVVYDIKDALLRHQLNVLLGIEEPDERDKK